MSSGEGSTYLFVGEGTRLELWRWNLPSSSTNSLYLHLAWGVRNRAKRGVTRWEDKPCLCFVDYKKEVTSDKGSARDQGHGESREVSCCQSGGEVSLITLQVRELPGVQGGALGLVFLQVPA